jgi:octopine/nopaline transport system permease protein
LTTLRLLGFGSEGWGGALLAATATTLAVALAALAVGLLIGAVVAAMKLAPSRTAAFAADAYTTVLRGVPDLLVIYLFYFGGSTVVSAVGQWIGAEGFVGIPSFLAGALAVGIVSGAYQAEVFRGAFVAIAPGELDAARAFGMSRGVAFRRIVAPQVLRYALPGVGNVWQLALKDSALISVTGLAELLRTSQVASGSTHRPFVFYAVAAALYLALSTVSGRLFDAAERHATRGLRRAIGEG